VPIGRKQLIGRSRNNIADPNLNLKPLLRKGVNCDPDNVEEMEPEEGKALVSLADLQAAGL
jgi:hypothetical protein